MNKRSAMIVAAALALTLVVGGVVIASGLVGPTPSAAVGKASIQGQKALTPTVETIIRTIKVHKRAPAPAAVQQVSSGSFVDDDDHRHGDESHGDDDD